MEKVRPKKKLGQHFLKDRGVAERIAGLLSGTDYDSVIEIGPGMGILTEFLIERDFIDFRVIEIDRESVDFLHKRFPSLKKIISGDFLRLKLSDIFNGKLAVIGNFPYNISSQILFRIIDQRDIVVEVVGMFQKEVAERICAGPGSRTYGILSVIVQAYYSTSYVFTVSENLFSPPPKVKSGVIMLKRLQGEKPACNEDLFFRVVKASFNQRRKMLRNSLKAAFHLKSWDNELLGLRPEQLSVKQFVGLTNWIESELPRE